MDTFDPTIDYRPIPNVPGYRGYLVGQDGSIWTCRKRGAPRGHIMGTSYDCTFLPTWRRLATYRDNWGYQTVLLWNLDTKRHVKKGIHALLLDVFVAPRPKGMLALHKNDDREDNRLENLYWGTKAQNVRDAQDNRRYPRSTRHHACRLSDDDVREIRQLRRHGMSCRAIAARFGMSVHYVRGLINGSERPHVL